MDLIFHIVSTVNRLLETDSSVFTGTYHTPAVDCFASKSQHETVPVLAWKDVSWLDNLSISVSKFGALCSNGSIQPKTVRVFVEAIMCS